MDDGYTVPTAKFIGEIVVLIRHINQGGFNSEFLVGERAIITDAGKWGYTIVGMNNNKRSGGCHHGLHFKFENPAIEILYG